MTSKSKPSKLKPKRKKTFKRREIEFPAIPNGMERIKIANTIKDTNNDDEKATDKDFGNKYQYLYTINNGDFNDDMFKVKKKHIDNELKSDEKHNEKRNEFYAIKVIDNIFAVLDDTKRLLKELKLLRVLNNHPNIVELMDLLPPKIMWKFNKLSMVFAYMPSDLKKLIHSNQYLNELHIKYILYQILLGIKFIHSFGIVHCDLKPEHILINDKCQIQITDFASVHKNGENIQTQYRSTNNRNIVMSSKNPTPESVSPDFAGVLMYNQMYNTTTERIKSRWYWAPELFKNKRTVHFGNDMWSVGCIFGELFQMQKNNCDDYEKRQALFQGKSQKKVDMSITHGDQLNIIFETIGTPNNEEINCFSDEIQETIKHYLNKFGKSKPKDLSIRFSETNKSAIQLLTNMLTFQVDKRIKATNALESSYFKDIRSGEYETMLNKNRFESINLELKTDKEKLEQLKIDPNKQGQTMLQLQQLMVKELMLQEIKFYNYNWFKQQYKEMKRKLKRGVKGYM